MTNLIIWPIPDTFLWPLTQLKIQKWDTKFTSSCIHHWLSTIHGQSCRAKWYHLFNTVALKITFPQSNDLFRWGTSSTLNKNISNRWVKIHRQPCLLNAESFAVCRVYAFNKNTAESNSMDKNKIFNWSQGWMLLHMHKNTHTHTPSVMLIPLSLAILPSVCTVRHWP